MATKVTLGGNPKNFVKHVDIVLLDGTTDKLAITYIYRTRKQFAEMVDEVTAKLEGQIQELTDAEAAARQADPAAPVKRQSTVEKFAQQDGLQADQVLLVAEGWELADPFTRENLLELESKFPGSLQRINRVYTQAVSEARQKN